MTDPNDILFIVVDLFCGAGGTTTGFEKAKIDGKKVVKVIACINHDEKAIKSHAANHKEVYHFIEDIRTLMPEKLAALVAKARLKYPNAKLVLWASLECTNFSKAKGGMSREADSRTLAQSLYQKYNPETKTYYQGDSYVQLLNPDYIMIENVVEFMSWGPLRIKTSKIHPDRTDLAFAFNKKTKTWGYSWQPVSKKNGVEWLRWRHNINNLGYRDEWRELNSANYGAYTSRNRLFGIFAKPGQPLIWPEQTHTKNPGKPGMFASLHKWKPVKEVLDFDDEGKSIFERDKKLSEKTLARTHAGLVKYVAGGKASFMLKYNSTTRAGIHRPPSIEEPCPVISTQNRLGIVQTSFLSKYYGGNPEGKASSVEVNTSFITQRNGGNPESKVVDINGPARTLTATGGNQDLIQTKFLTKYYSNGGQLSSVEDPAGTISTKDRFSVVQTCWIDKQYSGSANHQSIEQPAGAILKNDKHALMEAEHWIDRNFSQGTQHHSIEQPAGSITTVPKMNLVKAEKWIMKTGFNNVGSPIEKPCPTITANRKHHYLMNPQYMSAGGSIEDPCFTLIARMDKMPPYLVITESGQMAIEVYPEDSYYTRLIKEFMAMYGIVDIKMRMLKISELKLIQGFPAKYILKGNQSEQKKFIGNSVVPDVVKYMGEALGKELLKQAA